MRHFINLETGMSAHVYEYAGRYVVRFIDDDTGQAASIEHYPLDCHDEALDRAQFLLGIGKYANQPITVEL